ncbi:MAG: DUF1302 domain-containing protein [Pedobacter sp.]|nr:DUF1302 domain-containing protein [Pedobacter sp.]
MKNKHGMPSLRLAPRAAGFALATLLPLAVNTASAFELNLGEVTGALDTTVSYGTGWRLEDPDTALAARYPSYTAAVQDNRRTFINKNDGDANFDNNSRPITNVFKITADLELKYKDYGLFTRGTAFYDTVIMSNDVNRASASNYPNSASCNAQVSANPASCGFPHEVNDHSGHDARFLDAYVYGNFDVGGMPLNLRAGSMVVNWGEALFLQDGINSANPVSLSKLRLPGAEVKEALLPLPMLYASLGLTDSLTAEVFYQFDWDYSEPDDVGTFYSTDDAFAGEGANRILVDTTGTLLGTPQGALGNVSVAQYYNRFNGNQLSNTLTNKRGPDIPTDGKGQFGLAFRYSLDATEFGLFFMNYHSHKPVAQATTGEANYCSQAGLPAQIQAACGNATARQGLNAAHYIDTTTYQLVYPEDIQMYGFSFSTTVGDLSFSGELAYRPNDVILAELGDNLVAYNTLNSGALGNGFNSNTTAAGAVGFGSILNGGQPVTAGQTVTDAAELATYNLALVSIYNFGPTIGADGMTGVLEYGANYIPAGEDYKYASTASLLNLEGAAGAAVPAEGPRDDYLDRLSMGYRIVLTSTYNDVFAGVALSPTIRFAHDFKGNSHRTGNFLENRKATTVGLSALYNQAFETAIAYNAFWGAKSSNLLADRDNVTLTLKYSF